MILPAFTAERHAAGCSAVAIGRLSLAIDISYLHGAQQQTSRCRPMRQTDGQTTDRFTDLHTCGQCQKYDGTG